MDLKRLVDAFLAAIAAVFVAGLIVYDTAGSAGLL